MGDIYAKITRDDAAPSCVRYFIGVHHRNSGPREVIRCGRSACAPTEEQARALAAELLRGHDRYCDKKIAERTIIVEEEEAAS